MAKKIKVTFWIPATIEIDGDISKEKQLEEMKQRLCDLTGTGRICSYSNGYSTLVIGKQMTKRQLMKTKNHKF